MSIGARACIAVVAWLLAAASHAQVDTLRIPLRHLGIEDGLSHTLFP